MEFNNIDLSEMERQRYNAIKKKGKYIEVNVLVESTNSENTHSKMPVITTQLCRCNSKDIAYMYVSLKALVDQFIKDHPIECMYGEALMGTTNLGTTSTKLTKEEQPDEN